jgi:hypothetical protein
MFLRNICLFSPATRRYIPEEGILQGDFRLLICLDNCFEEMKVWVATVYRRPLNSGVEMLHLFADDALKIYLKLGKRF